MPRRPRIDRCETPRIGGSEPDGAHPESRVRNQRLARALSTVLRRSSCADRLLTSCGAAGARDGARHAYSGHAGVATASLDGRQPGRWRARDRTRVAMRSHDEPHRADDSSVALALVSLHRTDKRERSSDAARHRTRADHAAGSPPRAELLASRTPLGLQPRDREDQRGTDATPLGDHGVFLDSVAECAAPIVARRPAACSCAIFMCPAMMSRCRQC